MTILAAVPRGAEALALSQLLHGQIGAVGRPAALLYVALNDRGMDAAEAALPFFAPGVRIIRIPAWDSLPYDRVSPRPALVAERVQALAELASFTREISAPLVVLTTISAITQRVPPRAWMQSVSLAARVGESLARERLQAFLESSGYRRAGKAIEPGEYALRGSIVDIVPPGEGEGIRLDFFGDALESIRRYDVATQLSLGKEEAVSLYPASELRFDEEAITRFRAAYREYFGAVSKTDPLYEAISAGRHFPGMEHWLPLFHERLDSLFDYLPQGTCAVYEPQAEAALAERAETIRDYYTARMAAEKSKDGAPYHPLPPESLYLTAEALEGRGQAVWLSAFDAPAGEGGERVSLAWRQGPNLAAARVSGEANPFEQLKNHAAEKRAQGKTTLLACLSAGSCERIAALLAEHGAHAVRVEDVSGLKRVSGKSLAIAALPLAQGFETESLAVVSEQDLLGERVIRAVRKRKQSETFLAEAANFLEGELVVHREHGIGRFEGLVTVEAGGAKHDCLKLAYADDDRLFLPVENIELLTRYGAEDEEGKLDKLGAASWQARKARMKERITIAAEQLLATAAARAVKKAPTLEAEHDSFENFCARFGFAETEDQERSIDEVTEDLQSGRPMDRLICGDVGYGKTEVALRAAFVAASGNDKKQVALIVPTTLLARQHYRNFSERFDGFGIRVAQLSRMVNAAEQKRVREGLADGSVDIVIGTHALLSKQIQFKNLGLVIVDEEQHFGVGQKEKLKELKADVHVLTLSATPIPRTLQMALSGVRDLSLITTPPVDRLAIRSFVMPWDGVVLREAILRELHRGGRVFVVCPRIKDMPELKLKLTDLVPEAKLGAAHGQMAPSDLDTVMNDFYDGKYDVLLSTAIIESGLDIPTANTIIVSRADRFGLAQLYQMRGRVGRGKMRAYAYFLLPAGRELTKDAARRLEVMQSLDALGAGFQLASHDMDIRGFGNLVGEEQSGHVREVGVELYQQMLEEAVARLKASGGKEGESAPDGAPPPQQDWSPQINLGLSVLIPEEYVPDLSLRMGLYRRAGQLGTAEEVEAFAAEMIDRFGPLPQEVSQLLAVVRLKRKCLEAGVERIDAGPKGAVIAFREGAVRNPEALLAYIARHPTRLKLRPDQRLVVMQEWKNDAEKLAGAGRQIDELAKL